MKTPRLLIVGAVLAACTSPLFGGTMVPGFNSSALGANDDGSTSLQSLPFAINLFGTTYTGTYVNNNGNLTFTGPRSEYTPENLYTVGIPIIAPFFADVDTRGSGSNLLRFGEGTFAGRDAFGATWDGVGYYSHGTDKMNKFQVLLVNRYDTGTGNFDIYFNYDQIQWETGGASGGSGGLGGSSARAGYSSGVSANSSEIFGSAINGAFLDTNLTTGLIHTSNMGVPGRYLFQVRNGAVTPPGPSVPDSTSTAGLMVFALLAIGALRRKLA